eukprot:6265538-Prymnesium_polylepis.1
MNGSSAQPGHAQSVVPQRPCDAQWRTARVTRPRCTCVPLRWSATSGLERDLGRLTASPEPCS